MKIQNNRRIIEKIMGMQETSNDSNIMNYYICECVNNMVTVPADIETLKNYSQTFIEKHKVEWPGLTVDKCMMLNMIYEILEEAFPRERGPIDFFAHHIINECKTFNASFIEENPYFKNIKIDGCEKGDFMLTYNSFDAYELDMYDTAKRLDESFIDIPRVSFFTEPVKFPCVYQKNIDKVWMSVTPNEIFTMEQPIRRSRGTVLTLGCGMGYYAYMASLKDEVTSVTIVEREQDVIDLFEEFILPQFEYKEKIKVIKADAIEYLSNLADGEFDYCFADIWLNSNDFDPYFAVKEVGRTFRKTIIDYWIEDAFALMLSKNVFLEILTELSKMLGVKDVPTKFPGENTRLMDYIHRLLENESISSPQHVDYYVAPQNIIDMINSSKLNY